MTIAAKQEITRLVKASLNTASVSPNARTPKSQSTNAPKPTSSAKNSMQKDEFLDLWENRNDQLRNLGIRLVPLE